MPCNSRQRTGRCTFFAQVPLGRISATLRPGRKSTKVPLKPKPKSCNNPRRRLEERLQSREDEFRRQARWGSLLDYELLKTPPPPPPPPKKKIAIPSLPLEGRMFCLSIFWVALKQTVVEFRCAPREPPKRRRHPQGTASPKGPKHWDAFPYTNSSLKRIIIGGTIIL